jgi:hypothetical protein
MPANGRLDLTRHLKCYPFKAQRFLYVPPGLTFKNSTARFALSVLYGSQHRQRPLLYTSLTDLIFITVMKSVYSAVRTDSLYKAEYV